MTKTRGNPDIRLAFRFIKLAVLSEDNEMPKPDWADFDEHDMFDSVIQSGSRTGYTPDGNSKFDRTLSFVLGDSVVAMVELDGVQDPWGCSSWKVNRVSYREHWNPDTGGTGKMYDFDVNVFGDTYTDRRTTLANA
jgi:hypothetical protein